MQRLIKHCIVLSPGVRAASDDHTVQTEHGYIFGKLSSTSPDLRVCALS